jgi:hypothetical protein
VGASCQVRDRGPPQANVGPDVTVEMFFIDGPLPGFDAMEITEPELINSE